jgi:hypothetical protein
LPISSWKAAFAFSMCCQIWVVYRNAPWSRLVDTCCPRPVRSREISAARIPDGTRKMAPMLGIGMCKKIGPGRHPGCSHCWPDDACTSAS